MSRQRARKSELAAAIQTAAHDVGTKSLTWGAAGNISARLSPSTFLISASGRSLPGLEGSDLIVCRLDGSVGEGSATPSVETRMHAALYAARPDVGAILHASPFYATLVASSSLELDPRVCTDTAYFVGTVRRVPFRPPGSVELAEAAGRAAAQCNVLLLDNHGALTLGSTPDEAVTRMEALELLCRMAVYDCLGVPLRPLSDEQVEGFVRSLSERGTV